MSYTGTYVINKAGDLLCSEEYRNSHGFCAYIWTALCEKYKIGSWYLDENADKLWKLATNPKLLPCERIALETTFDYAIIRKEDFAQVIAAYHDFEHVHPPGNHVSHLYSIALEMGRYANDDDVVGFCFYQSSLSSNLWEEVDDDDYNIYRHSNHHFVPLSLDTVKE